MELETGNITVTEYPCPMCGQLMPMRAHATNAGRVVGRCQNQECPGLGRDVIEFDTSAKSVDMWDNTTPIFEIGPALEAADESELHVEEEEDKEKGDS